MDIFQLIAVLCPAAIPTLLSCKKDNKGALLIYMIYTMIINTINLIIVYFILNHQGEAFSVSFTVKYIALGVFNGIVCFVIASIVNKYFSIDFKIEKKR